MNLKEIINKLNNYKKGTFIRIGWKSEIESKAAEKIGIKVIKESEATVRLGVTYSHLKKIKESISAKENKEGESRAPWFKRSSLFGLLIEHKNDNSKQYLQMFPIGRNGNPKVYYFVNGQPIMKEQLQQTGYCNNSVFTPKGEVTVFNIPIENIRFIGK